MTCNMIQCTFKDKTCTLYHISIILLYSLGSNEFCFLVLFLWEGTFCDITQQACLHLLLSLKKVVEGAEWSGLV